MKNLFIACLTVCAFLLQATRAQAQGHVAATGAAHLAALGKISLPSADSAQVNVGETIASQPFTLLVLYRGVW